MNGCVYLRGSHHIWSTMHAPSVMKVLSALDEGPSILSDIPGSAGVSRTTVEKALAKLVRSGDAMRVHRLIWDHWTDSEYVTTFYLRPEHAGACPGRPVPTGRKPRGRPPAAQTTTPVDHQ